MKRCKRLSLLIFLLFAITNRLDAQSYDTLTQTVYDSDSNKPISNVLVQYKNSVILTDTHGLFTIPIALRESDSITFRLLGYKTITESTLDISKRESIEMTPEKVKLKEVKIKPNSLDKIVSKAINYTQDHMYSFMAQVRYRGVVRNSVSKKVIAYEENKGVMLGLNYWQSFKQKTLDYTNEPYGFLWLQRRVSDSINIESFRYPIANYGMSDIKQTFNFIDKIRTEKMNLRLDSTFCDDNGFRTYVSFHIEKSKAKGVFKYIRYGQFVLNTDNKLIEYWYCYKDLKYNEMRTSIPVKVDIRFENMGDYSFIRSIHIENTDEIHQVPRIGEADIWVENITTPISSEGMKKLGLKSGYDFRDFNNINKNYIPILYNKSLWKQYTISEEVYSDLSKEVDLQTQFENKNKTYPKDKSLEDINSNLARYKRLLEYYDRYGTLLNYLH